MEVFQIREQISETEESTDLVRLHCNVEEDIVQIERAFETSLSSGNVERAQLYAVRLKYYNKVQLNIYILYAIYSKCVFLIIMLF